jgi:2,3-bisphosphoglycerate-independent phosphoglycerate mutase
MVGVTPDDVQVYSEIDCPHGTLGAMKADGLMRVLF